MPVYVRKGGLWKDTDDVFTKRGGVWREVLAAYAYAWNPATAKLEWLPLFDRFQAAPLNVRGTSPTHSGGTLAWNAAPKATHYRVVQRVGSSSVIDRYYPTATGWITGLSQPIIGLAQDKIYHYTVIARRASPGGADVVSIESAKANLSTGHPPTPRVNTGEDVTIDSSRTDTWSKDNGWGQTGGDVVQGYATSPTRNGHGAVNYNNAYSQLAAQVNYSDIPASTAANPTTNAADHVEVLSAVIARVHRKTGGSGTPLVEVYAWRASFQTGPGAGDILSSQTSFRAPAEGADLTNLSFDGLLTWARQWVKKAPNYTGMLMYRTDGNGNSTAGYNGYCILRSGNPDDPSGDREWRLKLTVAWDFDYPALQAPVWTAGG